MTAPTPRRRRDRRPLALVSAATGLAVVVVAVIALSSRPLVVTPPVPSASLPPPTTADQPRAAIDGAIIEADLAHVSRDDRYRTPTGAVPAGATVTLRLRAAAGDLSEASVSAWDTRAGAERLVPMTVAATDATAGDHGYDYWEATVPTPSTPTILWYRFKVADGARTQYVDGAWRISAYEPTLDVPAWARGGIVYDVDVLRFRDGDDDGTGDLRGLTDKLDDLRDLGVTVIALTPFRLESEEPRSPTIRGASVGQAVGTAEDFERLVAEARDRGIRVVLEGRFDPVSSVADANLTGPDGEIRRWIAAGAAGWLLAGMEDLPLAFVRSIREAAKAADPEALVIGEQWGETADWLLGDEVDSTTDHRFRRAAIGLVHGRAVDLDGVIAALTPSAFVERMEAGREDVPDATSEVLVRLIDGQATRRILWTLTPGDGETAKADPTAVASGKAALRTLAVLQMTWPGMPAITYGTEVGIGGPGGMTGGLPGIGSLPDIVDGVGGADVEDAIGTPRPYPWDDRDDDLRDRYRTLGRLRRDHDALRRGDLRFVNADDGARTLAFARRSPDEVAVTVLNLSDQARDVVLALGGIVPVGTDLSDDLGDAPSATVAADGTATVTIPAGGSAIYITGSGVDLAPPDAPTGLTATASPGQVELVWAEPSSADATGYRIWRSLVSGGGYVPVGDTVDRYYVDPTVRNGTPYHYVITAVDEVGNIGPRSIEAAALPSLTVADARLAGPAAVDQTLGAGGGSAGGGGASIAALVRVANVTVQPGSTVGLVAQVGYGPLPASGVPDPGPAFTWSDMRFEADAADGADRLVGSVSPTEPGTYGVLLRVSTDGRRTWRYADLAGLTDPAVARAAQPVALTVSPAGGSSTAP